VPDETGNAESRITVAVAESGIVIEEDRRTTPLGCIWCGLDYA